MKKNAILAMVAFPLLLFLGSGTSLALDPIPKESGFSGFVRPGVGYVWFKSNMVASFLGYDLSDERIDTLDDSPDSQSNAFGFLPFQIAYTFASSRTQVFLGTELTNLVRFDAAQQLGIKQGIGDFGLLQAGVLFSGIPAKVWKDPYLTNADRDETKRKSNGVRLAWDRILGSNLQLQYDYRKIDIGSEKSGDSVASLTGAERDLLKRDGDYHSVELLYRFNFAEKHWLAPAFIYTLDDRDGKAMKSDIYDFQLTYTYLGDPMSFVANGFIGYADYDKRNPIFDEKQDDDRYGFNASIYYKNPWNWSLFGSKPMNFFVSGAYVNIDANIDFYKQEAVMALGGVMFTW